MSALAGVNVGRQPTVGIGPGQRNSGRCDALEHAAAAGDQHRHCHRDGRAARPAHCKGDARRAGDEDAAGVAGVLPAADWQLDTPRRRADGLAPRHGAPGGGRGIEQACRRWAGHGHNPVGPGGGGDSQERLPDQVMMSIAALPCREGVVGVGITGEALYPVNRPGMGVGGLLSCGIVARQHGHAAAGRWCGWAVAASGSDGGHGHQRGEAEAETAVTTMPGLPVQCASLRSSPA